MHIKSCVRKRTDFDDEQVLSKCYVQIIGNWLEKIKQAYLYFEYFKININFNEKNTVRFWMNQNKRKLNLIIGKSGNSISGRTNIFCKCPAIYLLTKILWCFIRCYGIGKTLKSRNECIVTNWCKNRRVTETIRV